MSDVVVHVAQLPSVGMGHLTSFLRLATLLLHHHCKVTLITPQPTVTLSEAQLLSCFHSTFPQVNQIHFHIQPSTSNKDDPLLLRVEAILASAHLLSPSLSSVSPPLSAVVSDCFFISSLLPNTDILSLPNYVLFTSSATMFTFLTHFSTLSSSLPAVDGVEIPGIPPIPRSSIPHMLLTPNSILGNIFMEDSPKVTELHGFLINTFEALEHQPLEALNAGKVIRGMPHVFAVGPFVPCEFEEEDKWGEPLNV